MKKPTPDFPVIAWWSGGVTSAVACWLAIQLFGWHNVRIVFIDTFNEGEDVYRFKADCEKWYGKKIETITQIGDKYRSIVDVWILYCSLNTATGAICSTELKRQARLYFQKTNNYSYQVFGFEFEKKEFNRARAMSKNYADSFPIYPLTMMGYDKIKCVELVESAGIKIPITYEVGMSNANCYETLCVQGGIGYWQWAQVHEVKKFDAMADLEHYLSFFAGKPVTMLKDQGKDGGLVFLKPYWRFPHIKDISMMKGRPPKPLKECNGFCGINDLNPQNETQQEINFAA